MNGASPPRPQGVYPLSFLSRIFGGRRQRARLSPLYDAIVATGRDPAWYREGQVPDTIDGRFDMVAATLTLVLLRLEREGDRHRDDSVLLTEIFIEDMDGTLRQIGIGDFVVGKHVGRMMGALGGRLGAFRAALADEAAMNAAVIRNIFREAAPSPEAIEYVGIRLRQFDERLAALEPGRIVAGELPNL